MDDEINAWLEDINNALDEIYLFLLENKNYFEFQKDLKGKRAIERNIAIIGEAINRILKTDPNFPISKARKIVDTRNRIIHGYNTISDSIIWGIIIRDLDKLKKEVKDLLEE